MNKELLRTQIVAKLRADHQLLLQAAKSSHDAATHEDNVPDSKYETLALEASYIAQGQANRAEQIRRTIDIYRQMGLQTFSEQTPIRLSALVLLEDEAGRQRQVFLGPAAGGLKLEHQGQEIMLITPESPLGRQLLGAQAGDSFELEGAAAREYEIISVE